MISKKKSRYLEPNENENTTPNLSLRHSKLSLKREIHSITGLHQEERKILNKQYNLTGKGIRKRTRNKAQNEQKKGNNKDLSEIKDIDT